MKSNKKIKRTVSNAKVHIQATFNNILVNVTDMNGNSLAWSSGGNCGFKGNKKGTPFSSQLCMKKVVDKVKEYNIDKVDVFLKGPWLAGRDAALKTLHGSGIDVISITDITPLPHNGVRPRKRRKV